MIRLARAVPDLHITAIDGSAPMIALARAAIRAAGLETRVTVVQGYIPGVSLQDHGSDAILSKDLLHHLPDPSALWSEIARLAQARRGGLRDGSGPPADARGRPPHRGCRCGARGSDTARGLLQLAVRGVHDRRASRTAGGGRTRSRGRHE